MIADQPLVPLEVADPFITIGAHPRDPFYRYRWAGRDLPSWSTIRAVAGLKPQVHAWALEGMVSAALGLGPTIAAAVSTGEAATLAWVRTRLWDAALETRDAAAKMGTRVHQAVEQGVDPDRADADISAKLRWFRDWLAVSGAQILGQEYQVYNLELGYGGTIDLLVLMPDGSIWVVDIKSGKSLWGEHALQLMGYIQGEFVGRDDVVDDALTAFHRSARGMAVLHVREDGWEFRGLRPDPETWAAFRGLLVYAVWQHDHDDIDAVTIAKKGSKR